MRVIDPGHRFMLDSLDGAEPRELRFVKRVGENFPGNAEPVYGGATTQEVLRALISRTLYVDAQKPSPHNTQALGGMRNALEALEWRAACERDEREAYLKMLGNGRDIESIPVCSTCGHIACGRHDTIVDRPAPTHPAADPAEPRAWEVIKETGEHLHILVGDDAEGRARSVAALHQSQGGSAIAIPLFREVDAPVAAAIRAHVAGDGLELSDTLRWFPPDMRFYVNADEPHTIRVDCESWPNAVFATFHFDGAAEPFARLFNAAPALVAEVERLRVALTPPAPKTEET